MSEMLDRFRREHAEIISTLKQAKELCVSSLPGHEKLMSVRGMLLDHMSAEDDLLYPALRAAAGDSEELKKVIDEFETDATEVSRRAREFFDRYDMECSDIGFIRDFALLMMMLMERIAREEEVLYYEFNRLEAARHS